MTACTLCDSSSIFFETIDATKLGGGDDASIVLCVFIELRSCYVIDRDRLAPFACGRAAASTLPNAR